MRHAPPFREPTWHSIGTVFESHIEAAYWLRMDPELVFTLSSCNPGGPLALGWCRRELVVATATSSDIHLHRLLEPNAGEVG